MRGHLLGFLLQLLLLGSAIAQPVVTNLTVGQQDHEPHHVVISYDVSGANGPMAVSLEVSNDNGTTFSIKPQLQYLSGAIGPGIQNGTGHTIIWNAMEDLPNIHWPETRVKVVAVEETDKGDDAEPPVTLTITSSDPMFHTNRFPRLYFHFSAPVDNFSPSDIYISGASRSSFYASEGYYTLVLRASGGSIDVSVPGKVTTPANTSASFSSFYQNEWTVELPNGNQIEMLRVPGKQFLMGSPDTERSRKEDETQHEVSISDDYYMSRDEITLAQWSSILKLPHPQVGESTYAPVHNVSWNEAKNWIEVLEQRLPYSVQFRFPTEAQWENACRAGNSERFSFGASTVRGDGCEFDNDRLNYVWYCANSKGLNAPVTPRLSSRNAWGLSEMHGNVAEWCADWYGAYADTPTTNPLGQTVGSQRVIRGGSWMSTIGDSRSAHRDKATPDSRLPDVGFRIVASEPKYLTITSSDRVALNESLKQTINFEFSNAVTGFDHSDIVVTNATKGTFTALDSKQYTLEITSISAGKITVSVPKDVTSTGNGAASYSDERLDMWTIMLPGNVPMEFVRIPAGTFRRGGNLDIPLNTGFYGGAPSTFGNHNHQVTISHPFLMAKTEVTERQWNAIRGSTPMDPNDDRFDRPQTRINWNSVLANQDSFISLLNNYITPVTPQGGVANLPTEAQWEFACRAMSNEYFSFSGGHYWRESYYTGGIFVYYYLNTTAQVLGWFNSRDDRKNYMWYSLNNGPNRVGQLLPNAYGLYDMHGNVSELCLDAHKAYLIQDVTDPLIPRITNYESYVVRGGAYSSGAAACGSSNRGATNDISFDTIGFRPIIHFPLSLVIESNVMEYLHRSESQTLTFTFLGDVSGFKPDDILLKGAKRGEFIEVSPREYKLNVICTGGELSVSVDGKDIRFSTPYTHLVSTPFSNFYQDSWSIELPNGIPMDFVRIPGGSFKMGSPLAEASRVDNEVEHFVSISEDYYLGTTPVTVGQWLTLKEWQPADGTVSGTRKLDPISQVSWDDIMNPSQGFMRRLNVHLANTNQGPATASLPTESQWEYACRANTATRFNFGDALGSDDKCSHNQQMMDAMWYCANSNLKGVSLVAQLAPNRWGLYDMHGNVWEWCQDWFGPYPTNLVTDPTGPASGHSRVIRGGSWADFARNCRSALRGASVPSVRSDKIGFRVLLVRSPIVGDPPASPTALPASMVTSSGFQANWDYVHGTTEYFLEVAEDKAFTRRVDGYSNLAVGRALTYPIEALQDWTKYYYRVRASNQFGLGGFSNIIETTTAPTGNWFHITSDAPAEVHQQKEQVITFKFSKPVTDFDADDVVVSGAIKGPLTGTGDQYTMPITGHGGLISITVAENVVTPDNPMSQLSNFYQDTWKVYLPRSVPPLEMIRIPAGSFTMGTPLLEISRSADEVQRSITISEDYYLSKTEVTVAQWRALYGTFVVDPYPATHLSWTDVMNPETGFIKDLNDSLITSSNGPGTFNLPTEAQWEYACRAGTDTRFYYGDSIHPQHHSGDLNQQTAERLANMWYSGSGITLPRSVSQKLPNAWGLYDMHGNVSEYCRDWYGSYSETELLDPLGPTEGSDIVIRGGGFSDGASNCRSGRRRAMSPTQTVNSVGFRVMATRPPLDPNAPPAPVAAEATEVRETEFFANWYPVPDATTYLLDIAQDLYFTLPVAGYENFSSGDTTSIRVTGLEPGTLYYYRVRVVNVNGTSVYSNAMRVVTSNLDLGTHLVH